MRRPHEDEAPSAGGLFEKSSPLSFFHLFIFFILALHTNPASYDPVPFPRKSKEEETKSLSHSFSFKSEQLKPSNIDFLKIMMIVGALRAEESLTQESFCPRMLIYKA